MVQAMTQGLRYRLSPRQNVQPGQATPKISKYLCFLFHPCRFLHLTPYATDSTSNARSRRHYEVLPVDSKKPALNLLLLQIGRVPARRNTLTVLTGAKLNPNPILDSQEKGPKKILP